MNRNSWTKEPGVAIVTGAAGGIGRAVVSALREERWTVVATDRDASVPPQLAEYVIWAGGDIRDSIVQQEVIDTADVLAAPRWTVVHCAGGSRPGNYVIDDPESWEQLRSLNMDAAYYFLTRVARHMIGNRIRGSIIPIASIAYLNGGSSPGYGMAKGAVVTMGYALAQALGPYDITVNCIAPGLIDTPMTRNGRSESEFVELAEAQSAGIPLRRIGLPTDVAGAAVYLSSDLARYVTGAVIPVTGGAEIPASQIPTITNPLITA